MQAEHITYCPGDVRDPDSLKSLFAQAGPDTLVIHAAGIIDISGQLSPALRAVNVEGTKHILHLCREYGVARLVHVSSVHAIPELPRGQTIREVEAFHPDQVVGGYAKAKAEATQAVLDAAGAGLDAVVVHPSGILGPYAAKGNHLVQMVADYLGGRLPACVRGGYDFVDVRDVAEGCLAAARRGRRGECYILSGRHYAVREVLDMACTDCP